MAILRTGGYLHMFHRRPLPAVGIFHDFSDLPRVGQPFDVVVSIGSIKNIKKNHKTQDLQGDDRGANCIASAPRAWITMIFWIPIPFNKWGSPLLDPKMDGKPYQNCPIFYSGPFSGSFFSGASWMNIVCLWKSGGTTQNVSFWLFIS